MINWKIDSKTRRATRGNDVVEFNHDGEVWLAQSVTSNAPAVDEALTEWLATLSSAVDRLRRAGEACFGRDWIMPMANELGVNRSSIIRWNSLERPLAMDHPIWADVLAALDKRHTEMQTQLSVIAESRKDIKAALRGVEAFESGRHAGGNS